MDAGYAKYEVCLHETEPPRAGEWFSVSVVLIAFSSSRLTRSHVLIVAHGELLFWQKRVESSCDTSKALTELPEDRTLLMKSMPPLQHVVFCET